MAVVFGVVLCLEVLGMICSLILCCAIRRMEDEYKWTGVYFSSLPLEWVIIALFFLCWFLKWDSSLDEPKRRVGIIWSVFPVWCNYTLVLADFFRCYPVYDIISVVFFTSFSCFSTLMFCSTTQVKSAQYLYLLTVILIGLELPGLGRQLS